MDWAWMSERHLIPPRARQARVCMWELQSQDEGRGLSGLLSPEGRLLGQRGNACQGLAPSPSSSSARGVCGRGQGQGWGKLGVLKKAGIAPAR